MSDNKGTLGKNKRREKDTHPEYAGQATIDGKDFWISAWVKTSSRDGEKFFSLSFREKQERTRDVTPAEMPDDDVPF